MLRHTIECLDQYREKASDPETVAKIDKAVAELVTLVPIVEKGQRKQLYKQLTQWPRTGYPSIDLVMANSDALCGDYRAELAQVKKQIRALKRKQA